MPEVVGGVEYPCADEVVDSAAFQTFAEDLDGRCCSVSTLANSLLHIRSARIERAGLGTPTFTVAVPTNITFNTEVFDNGNLANLGVNNDRLTIPVNGIYQLTAHCSGFATFTTITGYTLQITRNGGVIYGREFDPWTGAPSPITLQGTANVAGIAACTAADIIRAQFSWSGTGGPATLAVASLTARLLIAT